jgi:hypothetical protein
MWLHSVRMTHLQEILSHMVDIDTVSDRLKHFLANKSLFLFYLKRQKSVVTCPNNLRRALY